MFKIILWDIDGTILNFIEAEKNAIRKGFERLNIGECTDEMLSVYSEINKKCWKKIELGTGSKKDMLLKRFEEFFGVYGIDTSLAEIFNKNYQVDLGDTICFNDNSYELISKLKGKYRQYIVTNGTAVAQHRKIDKSGLGSLVDGWFISDEIGYEKPSKQFFDFAFESIKNECGEFELDEVLIIGDSLSSDIAGGKNAGIKTCFYYPNGEITGDIKGKADYVIENLGRVNTILGA